MLGLTRPELSLTVRVRPFLHRSFERFDNAIARGASWLNILP